MGREEEREKDYKGHKIARLAASSASWSLRVEDIYEKKFC